MRNFTSRNRTSFAMKNLSQRRQDKRSLEAQDNNINACAEVFEEEQ